MNAKREVRFRAKVCLFAGVFALLLACGGAVAQRGGGPMGGPPLDPEKLHAVWALQAKSVAQDLGLKPDTAAKLNDAYKAARESQNAALREMIKPGERPDTAAIAELNKAEKARLETALKGFLTPDQTTKAVAVLGTFARRVDPLVAELQSLGLDEKTMNAAVKLVLNHGAESQAVMQGAAGDRESMRAKSMELRQKLDTEMAKVLSADQMAKWKAATERRGPRGGGPEGGRPAPPPAAPAK